MNNTPFWNQSESRRLEFKEEWPSADSIARTAVAFANGAVGKIVFGVREESREIIGISDAELFSLEEKVDNHIFDLCYPNIVPEIYIQNEERKRIHEADYAFQVQCVNIEAHVAMEDPIQLKNADHYKPRSKKQRYRRTKKGKRFVKE
jgi:predicted HTH transcriptional regulator